MKDREELMQEICELLHKVGFYEGILESVGIQVRYTNKRDKKPVIIKHDFRRAKNG